jgi:hypothetical protein
MKSHKDLEVWQWAVELAVAVYAATRTFPKNERFGLSAQMRRSAVSIASNNTRLSTVSKMLHGLIRSVRTRHADSKASERP